MLQVDIEGDQSNQISEPNESQKLKISFSKIGNFNYYDVVKHLPLLVN